MKKLLLSAVALLAIVPAFARTLSPEEALSRVNAQPTPKARAMSLTQPRLVATGEFEGLATYYIYSDKNSAMILSASDCVIPIIGTLDGPISETTPMPEQLKWWLGKVGKAIAYYESQPQSLQTGSLNGSLTPLLGLAGMKVHPFDNAAIAQAPVKTAEKHDIEAMVKTMWDQGSPYNALCPTRTYTGCVATAMAMAMKFHNYPESGTGYVSTSYNGRTLSLNLDGKEFDWKNMTDEYSSASTQAEKDAVAFLMQAAGYSVKMSYGTSSSGALTQAIPAALVNNFRYDKGIDILYREYYTNDDWANVVYDELATGRPIIYGGSGTDGGHQFICDGYRASDGFFHFNWGWSGSYNGYFALTSLVPEGQGAGGNSDGFTNGQDAIIGVQKPVAGSVQPDSWIGVDGSLHGSASGTEVTLSADGGMFLNGSGRSATFDVAVSITNASGGTSYEKIYSGTVLQPGYGFRSLSFSMNVANGTYRIVPVYRLNGTSEWKTMKLDPYAPQYVDVTVNNGNITCTDGPSSTRPDDPPVPPTPKNYFTFDNLRTSTGFVAGEQFIVTTDVTNTSSEQQTMSLVAVVIDDEYYIMGEYSNYIQSVTLEAGETRNITFKGEIAADVPSGAYRFAILDSSDMSIVIYANIDVEGVAPESNLEITSMTVTPEALTAGTTFSSTLSVKNNGTSIESATIQLFFCHQDPNDASSLLIDGTAGSVNVAVAGGRSRNYTARNLQCPADMKAGEYMFVAAIDKRAVGAISVVVNDESGVGSIVIDENSDVEYFDLQGRRAGNGNLAPGLYIRRSGDKAEKVLVK